MRAVDIIIPSIWIAFWIYWLAASARTKATQSGSTSSIAIRVVVILVVLLSLRSGVIKGDAATVSVPWLQAVGFVVFLLGLALAVWARVLLGSNWGTPMSQKVDPELVTTGPYRYVRHPIYSGIIFGMIGTAMAVSLYWVVAVVLVGAYFVYAARVEERIMDRLFPESYPAYKRSTKMLIPFVF